MAPSACPVVDRAIPADSFLVHAADRGNLQALMDTHSNVFLEPGDYAKGDRPRSGSKVATASMRRARPPCPPSWFRPAPRSRRSRGCGQTAVCRQQHAITHDNCFEHISSSVTGNGVSLEHNEFVDFYDSSLSFDTSGGGFLRNNRFIRLLLMAAATWRFV